MLRSTWVRHGRTAALITAAVATSVTMAACGSSSSSTSSSNSGGENAAGAFTASSTQKKGGTLKVVSAEGFEHLDPGQAYFQIDYMVVYATQRPLYSFKPGDAVDAVPDFASGPPKVSADGKTVTVKVRDDVKYSPPVNRVATAQDVKYAIERGFTPEVPNGYAPAYFSSLKGSAAATKGGQIAGIETPDKTTIVFHLTKPFGGTFAQALSLPLTAPVPEEYAKKFDKNNPSTYDTKPTVQAFTGPYTISSFSASHGVTLSRNPNWDPKTDYRPAYADKIVYTTGGDPTVLSRQTLSGTGQILGDTPPAAQIKAAYTTKRKQIGFVALGNHYASLNTSVPPFNNINLRKAVLAGSNRSALVLARGGRLVGEPGTHFLPPTAPGFEEAGGTAGTEDFLKNPQGDDALAAAYMKKAGYPSGKYTGNARVTIVGANSDPGPAESQIIQSGLEKLGFKVTVRNVPQQTMYSKFCGVPKSKISVCSTAGWLPDFPDGYAYLFPIFSGDAITPVNNSNWPVLDVPAINTAMDKAAALPPGAGRTTAWANIDKMITAQAPAIPYIWDNQPLLTSTGVHPVIAKWNADWDLSFTSLGD
jgi:peptide/nickel transport system substrate-binding protein